MLLGRKTATNKCKINRPPLNTTMSHLVLDVLLDLIQVQQDRLDVRVGRASCASHVAGSIATGIVRSRGPGGWLRRVWGRSREVESPDEHSARWKLKNQQV